MTSTKLAIVSSHPIQYHAPWFRAMAAHSNLNLHVYYSHVASAEEQASAGFGVPFQWDIPLLDGYQYTILSNVGQGRARGGFWSLDTPEIANIIMRERFDAVLVLGWQFKSFWQAIWACWHTGTPVMVRGDSHLHTRRALWKQLAKWPLYRACLPRFDACLAVGTWSREYFLHYGVRPERIFLVPHVIDDRISSDWITTSDQQRLCLRRSWNLEPDSTVFLFAAKFIDKKRPMDFIRAVEVASSSGASIMGLMVGDGPLRAGCEEYVRDHRVPISFAGFLNQSAVARGYIAADAMILPSDGSETWGLVVNEAMACARPCLVSDRVGCGPDLIVTGETGRIFPLGGVDVLADMLVYYGTHDAELQAMGKKALALSHSITPQVAADAVVTALGSISRLRGYGT